MAMPPREGPALRLTLTLAAALASCQTIGQPAARPERAEVLQPGSDAPRSLDSERWVRFVTQPAIVDGNEFAKSQRTILRHSANHWNAIAKVDFPSEFFVQTFYEDPREILVTTAHCPDGHISPVDRWGVGFGYATTTRIQDLSSQVSFIIPVIVAINLTYDDDERLELETEMETGGGFRIYNFELIAGFHGFLEMTQEASNTIGGFVELRYISRGLGPYFAVRQSHAAFQDEVTATVGWNFSPEDWPW